MGQAIARVPALEKAGVKQMINGPESFTPDGNFILGDGAGCPNMFVGAGFNAFGIASGGGAGWVLAQWIVEGEAPLDLWVVDIRRFSGLHRDRALGRERTLEAYGKHYTVAFPHEEYESGRPRIVSPLYDRLKAHRAVFGSKLGWERPNWFAPQASNRGTSIRWADKLVRPGLGPTSTGMCAKRSAPSWCRPPPARTRRSAPRAGRPWAGRRAAGRWPGDRAGSGTPGSDRRRGRPR